MSRSFARILMACVVLNAIVVGATMSWPNTAHSTANNVIVTAVDFDHTFNSVTTAPHRAETQAMAVAVDFEGVFANVSTPHRMNTPPNRERLRNIGWRRILGS